MAEGEIPYRVTVAFGKPLEAKAADIATVRGGTS